MSFSFNGTHDIGAAQNTFRACLVFIAGLLASFHSTTSFSEDILVAVASNFILPMRELSDRFEQQTDDRVTLVSGSSGKLYAQIINGAPFQLFLSADQTKPVALEERGLVVTGTSKTYARGRLALLSSQSYGDDSETSVFQQLKQGGYERLAIANPRVAPYGVAALEVLSALGIDSDQEGRLVHGQNISQTYHFVDTGNVDMGFVSLSQVLNGRNLGSNRIWIVPEILHSPILQDMVLVKDTLASRRFYNWLSSEEAGLIMNRYRYESSYDMNDYERISGKSIAEVPTK